MINSVNLTSELVKCPSVTPDDAGTFKLIKELYKYTDFKIYEINKNGIKNLFLRWGSKNLPTFGFCGHIDVVNPGEVNKWKLNPFSGKIINNEIFGRGSVDMKSAVAAFCLAALKVSKETLPIFSIVLLITSDEEGKAKDGTNAILEWMNENNERMDYCIVGEPTCPKKFGDMIKIGRKGSLTGHFTIIGKQGHSAYPHLAINPIHASTDLIYLLTNKPLDNGSKFFEPSTLVATSIFTENKANNVIPQKVEATVNIRFNDNHTGKKISDWLKKCAKNIENKTKTIIKTDIKISGEPFYSKPGYLAKLVKKSVIKYTGISSEFSTSGGTSDARFIIKKCPVVEFGLVGKKMHAIDESVQVSQIIELENIYTDILKEYFNDIKRKTRG
ncbi:MAG: succinyl-diaminopimelate desuccinylase [Paracoccaceae bacterium]